MKLTLVNIDKSENYDAWVDFRINGIGASEVGTILGLNPYKSSTELFYQKIGKLPQKIDENIAMFMGNRLEPLVADLWEYYDDDEAKMIENFNSGIKTRHCEEVVGYIKNEQFPHLFFSPDRLIKNDSKLGVQIDDNQVLTFSNVSGVLEIKTISGFASKQWDGGVPPSYVVQLQTYLLGLGLSHGEIVFFEDGRKFTVVPMEFNQNIANQIIEKTTEFWERVLAARADMENCELYEPEPDGTEAYESFLNKKYGASEQKTIKGTDDLYSMAHTHKMLVEEIKEKEAEAREISNHLKNTMKEHECIDFGDGGKVTWKSTARGTRLFKNSIKY